MKDNTCKTCLWWWDLWDTGERICYNKKSPMSHKTTNTGCKKYEERVNSRMNLKIGMAYCKTK